MRLSHVENQVEQQLSLIQLMAHSYDNLIKNGTENVTSQRIQTCFSALKEN